MENRLANPAPLGLIAFALTTWLLSMINAGWYDAKGMPAVLAMALVYGGGVQLIAGILSYFRGNTFATVAFMSYGAFWISFVSLLDVFGAGANATSPALVGWYLMVWGAFTFFMWVASFRHNMVLQLVFLALWVTFALLACGTWTGWHVLTWAGGYAGLVTAIFAAYLAAAEVINGDYGRTVLPIWPFAQPPAESPGRREVFMEPEQEAELRRRARAPLTPEQEAEIRRRGGTRG
jgi:succinate-acetate transporter protein